MRDQLPVHSEALLSIECVRELHLHLLHSPLLWILQAICCAIKHCDSVGVYQVPLLAEHGVDVHQRGENRVYQFSASDIPVRLDTCSDVLVASPKHRPGCSTPGRQTSVTNERNTLDVALDVMTD